MQCARNRWGPGTTCEKPANTAASKELQERLAAMRNERTVQDKMWDTEPETSIVQTQPTIALYQTKK
jgi:hypothetical protein